MWIYLFSSVSLFVLVLVIMNFSSLILFFIYSELFWIFNYILTLFFSMLTNDPNYIVFGFFIFFLASVELVMVSIILAMRVRWLGYLDLILFFHCFNFVIVITIFWFITFIGSFFLNKKEYDIRNEFYECGFRSFTDFNFKLNAGTFASMIFVVFYDVELVFTMPYLISEDYISYNHYISGFILFPTILVTFYIDVFENVVKWDF